jgi:hypothetical protein
LVALVEEYSDPNIGASLGLHGEMMVLEGFARSQFMMVGKNTKKSIKVIFGLARDMISTLYLNEMGFLMG